MDEETKATSAGTITLALPGPAVKRSITVEQVRAYLRSQGWEHTGATDDGAGEVWERAPSPTGGGRTRQLLWPAPHAAAVGAITVAAMSLAAEAGITPGEMLARIADGPTATTTPAASTMTRSLLLIAADLLDYGAEAVRGCYDIRADLTNEERTTLALLANRYTFNDSPPEHWPASGVISAENMRTSAGAAAVMGALALGLREMVEERLRLREAVWQVYLNATARQPNRFRKVFPAAVPWRARCHDDAMIAGLVREGATDAEAADVLAAECDRIIRDNLRLRQHQPPAMRFMLDDRDAAAAEREACAKALDEEAKKADAGVAHALNTGNRHHEEAATTAGMAYRHGAEIIRKRGKR